jgi:hypothetical protein
LWRVPTNYLENPNENNDSSLADSVDLVQSRQLAPLQSSSEARSLALFTFIHLYFRGEGCEEGWGDVWEVERHRQQNKIFRPEAGRERKRTDETDWTDMDGQSQPCDRALWKRSWARGRHRTN